MAVKKSEMDEFEQLARAKLKQRQDELEALRESSKPLRDQIDALQAEHGRIDAELSPLLDKWRPINAEMQRIQNEIGRGARALGGYSTSSAEAKASEG